VPRQGRSASAGEQLEAIIQPGGQLVDAVRGDARRRQFDRQRNAVEPRQIAAIIAPKRRSGAKFGSAARALSRNSRRAPYFSRSPASSAASAGTASGGTG
jgi:hypothetical protein